MIKIKDKFDNRGNKISEKRNEMIKKLLIISLLLTGCITTDKESNINSLIQDYIERRNLEIVEEIIDYTIKGVGYYKVTIVKDDQGTEQLLFANKHISNNKVYGIGEVGPIDITQREVIDINSGKQYGRNKNYYFGISVGDYDAILYNNQNTILEKTSINLNNQEVILTTWKFSLDKEDKLDKALLVYE